MPNELLASLNRLRASDEGRQAVAAEMERVITETKTPSAAMPAATGLDAFLPTKRVTESQASRLTSVETKGMGI